MYVGFYFRISLKKKDIETVCFGCSHCNMGGSNNYCYYCGKKLEDFTKKEVDYPIKDLVNLLNTSSDIEYQRFCYLQDTDNSFIICPTKHWQLNLRKNIIDKNISVFQLTTQIIKQMKIEFLKNYNFQLGVLKRYKYTIYVKIEFGIIKNKVFKNFI